MKRHNKTALAALLLLMLIALLVSGMYLAKHIVCRKHIDFENVIYSESRY